MKLQYIEEINEKPVQFVQILIILGSVALFYTGIFLFTRPIWLAHEHNF